MRFTALILAVMVGLAVAGPVETLERRVSIIGFCIPQTFMMADG
jgi:hypothetical protein